MIRQLAALALLIAPLPAVAQRRIPSTVDASSGDGEDQKLSPMEEEMRVKRQIEAADKAHKDNVNRARHLVSLSESLVSAYKANKQLSREDLKKLERFAPGGRLSTVIVFDSSRCGCRFCPCPVV